MDISLAWLNRFLDPADVTADEADNVLTDAGFPIEERRSLDGGDTFLDVEITSNRGDCLSHAGLAREIAACAHASKPRSLVLPAADLPEPGPPSGFMLENRTPDVCPRFTARLIKGVKVAPSPDWLVRELEAVGQRAINNLVDITNWLTLGLGHPSHVFDAKKLAGNTLIVRYANEGEPLRTLDGVDRKLKATDLVVADAERAQSLAGVIGGGDSEVDNNTTDVVLEVACWDPETIRRASRRLNVRTDAQHRFERIVDPRTLDHPADVAAKMILELAGGELAGPMLDEGAPAKPLNEITLRPSRATQILGFDIDSQRAASLLNGLDVATESKSDDLLCSPPAFRPDLEREIDLIEELARASGFDAIEQKPRIEITPRPPQTTERAWREISELLAGQGFFETVTFSFVSPDVAAPWLPEGLHRMDVDDDRRGAEPTLRPSVVPNLLSCRRVNQNAQIEREGGVRLFERAAVFAQQGEHAGAKSVERRTLTLLMDTPGGAKPKPEHLQQGIRLMRGAIESIISVVAGSGACIECVPSTPPCAGWDPDAHAEVMFSTGSERHAAGRMGLVSQAERKRTDLDAAVVCAELDIDLLLATYPPMGGVRPLPAFPHTERDVSLLLDEQTRWGNVAALVHDTKLEHLESLEHAGVFRGKQAGAGKKSVTLRLRFRAPDRTLRREEVDPQIQRLVERCTSELNAELRGA